MNLKSISSVIKHDLSSGVVVFLVALPLCLGIALASGAPLFSGLLSGIIGGILIGALSKSQLSVSGPAAGLAAIVLHQITQFGAFNIFLCAVVVGGIFQVLLGLLKAGSISYYFPSNVIKGMLAAIGIIIILNQLEHAFGIGSIDKDEEEFKLVALVKAIREGAHHWGALLIASASVCVLLVWEKPFMKRVAVVPGALVAVLASILLNRFFIQIESPLAISDKAMLVTIPVMHSLSDFAESFTLPDVHGFFMPQIWLAGMTIAVVASIETLLCIEAADKLDPQKRNTPANRELLAQGVGNICSGLIGGLPITSVIVRTSANINSGAKTKLSAILHGMLLLLCAITIPSLLNQIPLATLAAILILTGFKLCKPAVFAKTWKEGKWQFIPFLVTVAAIVFTDLLKGVALGMAVSIAYLLRQNIRNAYYFHRSSYRNGDVINIQLSDEVSFLNKASILLTLDHLPENSFVVIDAAKTAFIDHDVLEVIREFRDVKAPEKNITLVLNGFREHYEIENSEHISMLRNGLMIGNESPQRSSGTHTELIHALTQLKFQKL
jgi:carbonic anhydrase